MFRFSRFTYRQILWLVIADVVAVAFLVAAPLWLTGRFVVWDLANEGITNLRDGQPTCEPVVVVDGADGPILHLDTSYKTVDELQVASLNAECVHLTVHNDRAFDSHRVWLYTLPEEPFYSMTIGLCPT